MAMMRGRVAMAKHVGCDATTVEPGCPNGPPRQTTLPHPRPSRSPKVIFLSSPLYRSDILAKVHPFFAKPTTGPPTPLQWLPPLGSSKSCLHAVNLSPKPSSKVAAFDLDGTLIKGDLGSTSSSWEWWRASVPTKLREVLLAG